MFSLVHAFSICAKGFPSVMSERSKSTPGKRDGSENSSSFAGADAKSSRSSSMHTTEACLSIFERVDGCSVQSVPTSTPFTETDEVFFGCCQLCFTAMRLKSTLLWRSSSAKYLIISTALKYSSFSVPCLSKSTIPRRRRSLHVPSSRTPSTR